VSFRPRMSAGEEGRAGRNSSLLPERMIGLRIP
jgi:hypothetical protein